MREMRWDSIDKALNLFISYAPILNVQIKESHRAIPKKKERRKMLKFIEKKEDIPIFNLDFNKMF